MDQQKLTRIITLEGIPGSLDTIIRHLQKPGTVVIPKSSDARGNNLTHGIVSCTRDILAATRQIKKCMGRVDVIIVPHYFDIPMVRHPDDFLFARRFISRHMKYILRAHGMNNVQIEHVHIRIPYEYVYEILLSNMSCRTLGTGDFSMYTKHLLQCQQIRRIDVPLGAFDTESMTKEIVDLII